MGSETVVRVHVLQLPGVTMLKLMVPGTLLLVCSTSFAQTPPPAQQQSAVQPKAKQRVICHDEGEIGSRLASRRVCLTEDQWRQREQDDKDNLAERQRRSPR